MPSAATNSNYALSNDIGNGLSCSLSDNNRTLTINGSGTMIDFISASAVPWRGYASDISKVVFSDSVNNIGAYAFAGFSSLRTIQIPDTSNKIGVNSFYNSAPETVDFNMTNQTIDQSAFYNTPFYRNYLTTETAPRMNLGSAKRLTGSQVVVNFFVNFETVSYNNSNFVVEKQRRKNQ